LALEKGRRIVGGMKAKWMVLLAAMAAGLTAGVIWLARDTAEPPPAPVAPVAAKPKPVKKETVAAAPSLPRLPIGEEPSTNRGWRGRFSEMRTNEEFIVRMSGFVAGRVRDRVGQQLSEVKAQISLTDEQEQRIKTMIDDKLGAATNIMARAMRSGQSNEEDAQALKALYDQSRAEMQQIMTPDQWAGYTRYEGEQRQKAAGQMADGQMQRMQNELQLSDAQQEQVRAVLQQQAAQSIEQMQSNPFPSGDWQQRMEQRAQARREALSAILTPEQMQSYEQMESSRRRGPRGFMPQ
jgi:hypothetical protein